VHPAGWGASRPPWESTPASGAASGSVEASRPSSASPSDPGAVELQHPVNIDATAAAASGAAPHPTGWAVIIVIGQSSLVDG
jgi:hypothetical protein